MMKRGRGRPPNQDPIPIDDAVTLAHQLMKTPKPPWTRKTLRNWMSTRKLHRIGGTYHQPLVDRNEILKICEETIERQRDRHPEKAG